MDASGYNGSPPIDSAGFLCLWLCRVASMLLQSGPHAYRFPRPPLVMGIVNVTPDSFSDGGRFDSAEAAIAHGLRLVADGADILDIGGESSRPGSQSVTVEEELRRVLPVVSTLARQ